MMKEKNISNERYARAPNRAGEIKGGIRLKAFFLFLFL